MKISKQLLAAAALVVSFGATANAQVVGSIIGTQPGPFLTLSLGVCTAGTPCTLTGPGGTVANIVGGTVLQNDQGNADQPGPDGSGLRFLAAGPTVSSQPSVLTFTTPVDNVSFLWGSPDLYNILTVTSTVGPAQVFTVGNGPGQFNFANGGNGDQLFAAYVNFQAVAGSKITSLSFTNNPSIDAFEVANFNVNTVPEPSTYVLMAAGLAGLGLVSKRRKRA